MQELILPEKIKRKIDDHVDASGKRGRTIRLWNS